MEDFFLALEVGTIAHVQITRQCDVISRAISKEICDLIGTRSNWRWSNLNAISHLEDDCDMRDNLVREGKRYASRFDWRKCAMETSSVYNAVLN